MRLYRPSYRDKRGTLRHLKTWSYDFSIDGRRFQASTGLTDRRAAEKRAKDLRRDAERRQVGLPSITETAALPINLVIAEYIEALRRRNRTQRYIDETTKTLVQIAHDSGATTLAELNASALERVLHAMHDYSSRTQNKYRQAVSSLFRWLIRKKRWDEDPTTTIETIPENDRARYRAFNPQELERLLAATPPHRRETWQRRRAFYALSVGTGLRAGEIIRATRAYFVLEQGYLFLPRELDKSNEDRHLPLEPWLVEVLHPLLQPLAPGAQPWRSAPNLRSFLGDLVRARIPRDTIEGRVTLHSLRRTFITRMVRAGLNPNLVDHLSRHRDPKVTRERYIRLNLADARRAVALLPDPRGSEPP